MFPNKFRNIFVAETMFPSLPTCFQMFPARETLYLIGSVETPRKFIIAELSIRKVGSSSVLIIRLLIIVVSANNTTINNSSQC